MWIICQVDDSHEISRLIFSEKLKKKWECYPLKIFLALYGLRCLNIEAKYGNCLV